jgi:hypothetical protein
MSNSVEIRLSEQRDDLIDWVTDKFQEFMQDERIDDALALADEFFEWLDPEQLDTEETLYTDYDEIRELDQ